MNIDQLCDWLAAFICADVTSYLISHSLQTVSLHGLLARHVIEVPCFIHPLNHTYYRTVVSVSIGPSHALYTSLDKHRRTYNSGVLTVGVIDVHIPQNPGTLHSMVTRNSRRIHNTIQEFMKSSASKSR